MRWITALAAAALLAFPAAAQTDRRTIAIGDIHGAYDQFASILTRAGLIDAQQKWIGGRTRLVQTGDYTDRGPDVRKVLDLLMTLEDRARGSGGEVVTLMGNHEVMNIIGDMRYVTEEIVRPFSDGQSEVRRTDAWRDYTEFVARQKPREPAPGAYKLTREAWMAAHPPGWLEYRQALSGRGRYGRWLRGKAVAALIDGTIFMHAGISPDLPATVDAVNVKAREELNRYEAYLQKLVDRKIALPYFTLQEVLEISFAELQAASAVMEAAKIKGEPPDLKDFDVALLREALEVTKIDTWSIMSGEGPLWFRGYANWPEDEASRAMVFGFLDKYKVTRVVVGHTPQPKGIVSRFGGRVVLIDTGMLVSVYNGRPAALEIRGAQLNAIYEDGVMPLSTSSAPPMAAAR